ncbi:unnamed protein product [Spirodela intermedia]|uniref:Uncharacterized protein n=1 Tax=Spirodela intermedia TaxID=51605 RepID=A0A7I8ISU2_SPIIN|nr:unnamed protein product [Spirodela intermedia]CAA6660850.1 unnamed protein product [Spirodela intermedia]
MSAVPSGVSGVSIVGYYCLPSSGNGRLLFSSSSHFYYAPAAAYRSAHRRTRAACGGSAAWWRSQQKTRFYILGRCISMLSAGDHNRLRLSGFHLFVSLYLREPAAEGISSLG